MPIPSALTELAAVNRMLSSIGEMAVDTVDEDDLVSEAGIALTILRDVTREVEERGWHFNNEDHYELRPNDDDEILVPATAARVSIDPDANYAAVHPVVRGNRLYDLHNHTYTFDGPIQASIIWFLPFEELPPAARTFITIRAARQFAQRIMSQPDVQYTERDEVEARDLLNDYEFDAGAHTIFDSADMQRRINRRIRSTEGTLRYQ